MTLNTGSPKGHPIKILLIDDDEMMRIFLRDIFWVHGKDDAYAVTATGSMKEAVSIIENAETRPDIVFLDLMLPAEDGVAGSSLQMERSIGLIKKLKNNPEFSKVKIVVFSGHKDTVIQNKIKDMGVAGYLVKGDFMPKEIISFVETIHK